MLSLITLDFEGFSATTNWNGGTEDGFQISYTGGSTGDLLNLGVSHLPLAGNRLASDNNATKQSVYTLTESDGTSFRFMSLDTSWVGSAKARQQLSVMGYLGTTLQGRDVYQPENGPATFLASNLASKDVDRLVFTMDTHPNGDATQVDNIVLDTNPYVIDDGDAQFTTVGTWSLSALGGFLGDSRFYFNGTAAESATWTFVNVTPGAYYRVYTTYPAHPTSSTQAPFTILDGTTPVATEAINQRVAPDDLSANGAMWEQIGTVIRATGTTLAVRVNANGVDGSVRADSVRLEPTTEPPPANPIDNGDDRFSQVGLWLPSSLGGFQGDSIFYLPGGTANETATWTFAVTPGTTYSVYTTYPAHPSSSTQAPFTIFDGSTEVGFEAINQRLGPNDLTADGANWEKVGRAFVPTTNTVTVRVAANGVDGSVRADAVRLEIEPNAQIVDDGDAAFATVGAGWTPSSLGGFQGDSLFNLGDSNARTATWTFTVSPGESYRIYTTYPTHPTSSTQAPFTILDGNTILSTATVNQQLSPDDLTADGADWEQIGSDVFFVNGTTLKVRLVGNGIDGAVRADAVRIELAVGVDPANAPQIENPSIDPILDPLNSTPGRLEPNLVDQLLAGTTLASNLALTPLIGILPDVAQEGNSIEILTQRRRGREAR